MPYIHLNKNKKCEKLCTGSTIYYLSTPDKGNYDRVRSFVMLDLDQKAHFNSILKANISPVRDNED